MKKKSNFVLIGFTALCAATFLGGCSHIVLFDPKGPIGDAERFVIIAAFVLMLIVVIPVFVMVFWFSLKYRASNIKATYMPKWSYSGKIDLAMWLVPLAIIAVLGCLAWIETHDLDPFKPIKAGVKPISIEVVSLNWKWLFIYPDYNVAVVNQLAFPAKVPLSFKITSDTVLTAFFIPQLGSQIYAMAGRQTRLHLMADESGIYAGHNQQFSGSGYADMHFKAIATSRQQFEAWVQKARQSPNQLDLAGYEELKKPTSGYPVTCFSSVTPGLFDHIIREYQPISVNSGAMSRDNSGSTHLKTFALERH
ncbi:MAG: ubiquinol oxidase subunit II [Deltaproteobacteria bacterium]|jgi:cytochrome o ubiquinol oxidase subunit 2